jgi:lipopolysaccharide export LptBFGC system permease protein LptF
MKRLERYLLVRWLGLALPLLLAISTVLVAITVAGSLQWTRDVPAHLVLQWVSLQFPAVLVRVAPVVFLTAGALLIGDVTATREAMAARAGGVRVSRALRPWWGVLLVAAVLSLVASQWLVPTAERRAAELWWSITEGRPATFRLRGVDLRLPEATTLRFERYDEASDVLLDVRVTTLEGDTVRVVRAASATWQGTRLELADGVRVSLALAALDRPELGADAVLGALVDGPVPIASVTLPELRAESVARFSGGTAGDGRSLSRHLFIAGDRGSSYGARQWAAFSFHERLAAAFAPLVLTFATMVVGLRHAPSAVVAFGIATTVGIAWLAVGAVGNWLVVASLVPPWFGAWFGHLIVAAVGAVAALRR